MLRSILVVAITLAVSRAHARGFGLFADSLGTSCSVDVPYPGGPVDVYVLGVDPSASEPEFGGFTFRVAGVPEGWVARVTVPSDAFIEGDILGTGGTVGFPSCRGPDLAVFCRITLTPAYSVQEAEISLATAASLDCPTHCDCWSPPCCNCACVPVSPARINGECTTGVAPGSWGRFKSMLR